MNDETSNVNPHELFLVLESTFMKLGFSQEQIVSMDITAGEYLVTNPTEADLPRVICSINQKNEFKVEYSQYSENTLNIFFIFLTELQNRRLVLMEGQLIDTKSGSILEDFEIDNSIEFNYAKEIPPLLLMNKDSLSSLKFYLTFNIQEAPEPEITIEKKNVQSTTIRNLTETHLEGEITAILDFISHKTTKCIQSKHLLELYPQATKKECLNKLKDISQQGYLIQSGPWFLLNHET